MMKKWFFLSLPLLMLATAEAKMVRIDKTPISAQTRLISSHDAFEESGYYYEMMEATIEPEEEPQASPPDFTKSKPRSKALALTQDPIEKPAKPMKKPSKPQDDSGAKLDKELQKEKEKGASIKEDDKFYPLGTSRSYSQHTSPSHHESSYEHTFIKTLSILLVLIILIFATIWMFRRLSFGKMSSSKAPHGQGIRVLERRALSPKTMLYMVEAKGKKSLIVESQLEVRALLSLDDENDSLDPDL